MYNLLVSADDKSWDGDPWNIDTSRCISEYTDKAITIEYGDLTQDNVNELRRYPCLFAYETACKKTPSLASPIGFPCHFGMKRDQFLVFKGLAQIACQSQATHLGNAGWSHSRNLSSK